MLPAWLRLGRRRRLRREETIAIARELAWRQIRDADIVFTRDGPPIITLDADFEQLTPTELAILADHRDDRITIMHAPQARRPSVGHRRIPDDG